MKMARLSFILVLVFTMTYMVMRATSAHASVIVTVGHLLGSALGAAFLIHSMDDEARAELWAIVCGILTISFACYIGKSLPLLLAFATIIPFFLCMRWSVIEMSKVVADDHRQTNVPTQSLRDFRSKHAHDVAMEAIRRTQR